VKVPVYEQQQVAPQSVGLPIEHLPNPNFGEVDAAAASLDRAGSTIAASVRREEDKARAAEITDSETELTKRVTGELHGDSASGKTGFMSLQGRAAEADGAPVMQRIEKHRKDIADSLKDGEAKKLFLARTGKQVEAWRSSVETYVSGQRKVADVASLKARADAASEAIYNSARIGDGASVQQQSVALEGPIRALAVSPEDAEHDVAMWRRQTVKAQLDAFMDVKRLDVAEALLNDTKDQLGPELVKKYQTEIDKRKLAVTAEGASDGIISKAQEAVQNRAYAEPDRATAEQLLAKLPADVQEKAGPIVRGRLAMLTESAIVQKKEFINSAIGAYNRNRSGFFATPMADRLNDVDAPTYMQLRNQEDRALERVERKQRVRQNDAAARREQANIDKIAINEWQKLILTAPNEADIEQFKATHQDMSAVAVSQLEPMRLKAAKVVDKAGEQSISEFTTSAMADADGFLPEPGSSKASKDAARNARDDFKTKAQRAYMQAFEENKGQPLSPEQAANLRAALVRGLPVNPKRPETIQRFTEAVKRGAGAPATAKPSKRDRALQLRGQGKSSQQIADTLNAEGY